MYPKSIQKLIEKFTKFPTIGPRTAARFVFYLLRIPKEEVSELLKTISELKEKVKTCSFCFNPFEDEEEELCPICRDNSRDKTLLCIVEKETDLISIEKTKKYNGLYFILGDLIDFRKGNKKLTRQNELTKRTNGSTALTIKEIIIALNPTTEAIAATLYLEKLLKPLNIKITRLGRGLPVGGELEYADEETLSSALESRK